MGVWVLEGYEGIGRVCQERNCAVSVKQLSVNLLTHFKNIEATDLLGHIVDKDWRSVEKLQHQWDQLLQRVVVCLAVAVELEVVAKFCRDSAFRPDILVSLACPDSSRSAANSPTLLSSSFDTKVSRFRSAILRVAATVSRGRSRKGRSRVLPPSYSSQRFRANHG
jgi:hypothetical protein